MPPTTWIFLSSTKDFRIGPADFSLSTLSATLLRMALVNRSPGWFLHGLDRRPDGVDQRRQVTGQRGAVLDRFDGGVDRAAGLMTEHQDQRRIEHLHGIFEARDHLVAGEISGDAADEQVAARGVEAVFRGDPGIGAAQDGGEWILPFAERFALVAEIVPPRIAFDVARIAFHQPVQRGIGRDDVFWLWRRLGRSGEGPRRDREPSGGAGGNFKMLRRAISGCWAAALAQRSHILTSCV